MSKASIIPNQDALKGFPDSASVVVVTAAIISGVAVGRKRSGRTSSWALVLSAMAAKRVPAETNPIVARRLTRKSGG